MDGMRNVAGQPDKYIVLPNTIPNAMIANITTLKSPGYSLTFFRNKKKIKISNRILEKIQLDDLNAYDNTIEKMLNAYQLPILSEIPFEKK